MEKFIHKEIILLKFKTEQKKYLCNFKKKIIFIYFKNYQLKLIQINMIK